MTSYLEMDMAQLQTELESQKRAYQEYMSENLALDMTRGKPCSEQLDLSSPMLTILEGSSDCFSEDGTDCRNYGVIDGIPEAKRLMSWMLDCEEQDVFVFGNSSLTVMHDAIARALDFGCLGSVPWGEYSNIRWLCPSPGYDRHFAMLKQFGIEMVAVEMTQAGPNMDQVEELCSNDPTVKGIWCVPKYANPSGVTYSDETVLRLASMDAKAEDFRIFWDNAYCVHDLYKQFGRYDSLLDIAKCCTEAGNPDRYLKFASTSKVTFPGAGLSAMSASKANLDEARRLCSAQMIGHDKLNQLRHARFLVSPEALEEHMFLLADILRPKFELVESKLASQLDGTGIARWTNPNGGYFVSFDGIDHTARRTVQLAGEAGVRLTSAGATWPYGDDPHDSNIRIAPTMPSVEELGKAMDVFCCCSKIAALEELTSRA